MSEVKELSADLVDPKNTEKSSQLVVAEQEKLSEREIGKILNEQADKATVLDDGSLYIVDTKFANDVVYKSCMKASFKEIVTTGIASVASAGSFVGISMAVSPEASSFATILVSILVGGSIPVMTLSPLLYFLKKRTVIPSSAIRKIQPKITEWLKEQYDVEISDKTSYEIVKNALAYSYYEFTAKNKKIYHLKHFSEDNSHNYKGWSIEEKLPAAQQQMFKILAPKTSQQNISSITTLDAIEHLEPYSAEHQTFIDKITLLKQQNLAPEHEHVITRAQQEAHSIIQSAKLLKQLGDDTHEDSVVKAFTALNKELDNVINSMLTHQRNELATKKQLIEDRTREPLTLIKE